MIEIIHPSEVLIPIGLSHLRACDDAGITLSCCGTHGTGEEKGMPFGSRCECLCHRTRYATRCVCSFPHPPHDFCDGNPDAKPFSNTPVEN